jgi:hypothetical protein
MKSPFKNWTENMVKKEAKKYKTRTEFQKYSKQAYRMALRFNLLDKLFPLKPGTSVHTRLILNKK